MFNIDYSTKHSIREAFGNKLAQLGEKFPNIVVLDADVSASTQTKIFAKKFPERFFDVGIAEQDLIGTAAGLALTGKIPFAAAFAVFATGRTYDQIRTSVCYQKANVKIIGTHGGITVGEDGATHQALEDILYSPIRITAIRKKFKNIFPSSLNGLVHNPEEIYIKEGEDK